MNDSSSDDINNAIFSLEQVIRQDMENRNSTDQVLLEVKCTNCLQRLIDIVNTDILKNFSLKLRMESDDSDNFHQHHHLDCNRNEKKQEVFTQ